MPVGDMFDHRCPDSGAEVEVHLEGGEADVFVEGDGGALPVCEAQAIRLHAVLCLAASCANGIRMGTVPEQGVARTPCSLRLEKGKDVLESMVDVYARI